MTVQRFTPELRLYGSNPCGRITGKCRCCRIYGKVHFCPFNSDRISKHKPFFTSRSLSQYQSSFLDLLSSDSVAPKPVIHRVSFRTLMSSSRRSVPVGVQWENRWCHLSDGFIGQNALAVIGTRGRRQHVMVCIVDMAAAKITGSGDGFDLVESIRMTQPIEMIVALAKHSGCCL
jgi:hypothetical protein